MARPANCWLSLGRTHNYDGKLGVIALGAFADLLVVDNNPETGLGWLRDYENSLCLIM